MAEELETVEPAAWPLPPSPTFAHFPALQPPFKLTHAGPIAESNWAIPSHLIAGAYPGSLSPEEAEKKTRRLVESGVKVFLSLLDDGERARFNPYVPLVQKHLSSLSLPENTVEFLSLPIPDQHITKDDAVMRTVDSLLARFSSPEPPLVYIHCWGGHGRTGTLISVLLGIIYNLEPDQALELCNAYHSQRVVRKSRSPQAASQFDQVRRLLGSRWWEKKEAQ